MSRIIVCGLINMETTVPVQEFPVKYSPIEYKFFGITTHPSGVGLNLSSALTALGSDVKLLSVCGNDLAGKTVRNYLKSQNIDDSFIVESARATAQSVILYDDNGKRKVYCDLTDMQEISYDSDVFTKALDNSEICVLCNINFARPMISIAKNSGKIIATDVHCLSDINDEYNKDFIRAADILFLSNEYFIDNEKEFVGKLKSVTDAKIVVVGMGKKGALLYLRESDSFKEFPAVYTRPVINTVGAGDSLFSCFLHFYSKTKDPIHSLKMATVFASYKIGDTSACRGFLSEAELQKLAQGLDL